MENSAIDTTGAVETRARFTCDPAALEAAAAYLAKRIIDRRGSIPILSYVRIVADPRGHITLTGTNLDQEASLTLSAEVESPGVFCADSAILADMASKLRKSKDCHRASIMDNGEGRAIIYGGRGRFNVPTLSADDFPVIRFDAPLSAFTAPPQFIGDLAALSPCMEADGHKYYLHGIAMQVRDMAGRDSLVMVATDGHQMGIASRPIPAGAGELADCIIPSATVAALIAARKLVGDDAPLSVESTGSRMRFTLGDIVLTSKLIDGTFPDWTRVWGEDGPLAPIEAQEALFPDLLPGAPVAMLEKLAKPFKGALAWSPARNGQLGTVASDPGLLFGGMKLQDDDGCGKNGFSYKSKHGEGEITGPDGLTYPVAFSDKAIHLSANQVRALIGESCFETFPVTIGGKVHHVLQWLWDDGAGRFLTVRQDGRCFGAKESPGLYLTRGEIEAALSGESLAESFDREDSFIGPRLPSASFSYSDAAYPGVMCSTMRWYAAHPLTGFCEGPFEDLIAARRAYAAQCASAASQSAATEEQEPSPAPDSQIAPEALSEAPSPNLGHVDIIVLETEGEGPTWHCSKSGHDTHIAASKAQPEHCWKCDSIVFHVPRRPLSGESITPPTALARPKRTPAHERAVRRAWAERKARRDAEAYCVMIERSMDGNGEMFDRELAKLRAKLDIARQSLMQREAELGRVRASKVSNDQYFIEKMHRRVDQERAARYDERAKRRRSTMLARDLQKRLNAEYRMVDRANERRIAMADLAHDLEMKRRRAIPRARGMIADARQSASFERHRADTLAAQLAKAGQDIAELRAKSRPPLSRFMNGASSVALRVAA